MSGNNNMIDSLFGHVRAYANSLHRKRAERILNELPAHLHKDVGWPDTSRFARTD